MTNPERLAILKTHKMYLAGKFVRSEGGLTRSVRTAEGDPVAEVCQASRKDARDAVRAARAAQPGWAKTSPYLRGQILYRVAEMLEDRLESLASSLAACGRQTPPESRQELAAAVDRLVYYAGWSDKFAAAFGSVNPVSSPHFSFTVPEPMGVMGIISPATPPLLGLVSLLAAVIVTGNTAVCLVSDAEPLASLALGEVLAVSDVPAGVVNLLSGNAHELGPVLASHKDVNGILASGIDSGLRETIQQAVAGNLKRVSFPLAGKEPNAWFGDQGADPYLLLEALEFKTTWHPVGL